MDIGAKRIVYVVSLVNKSVAFEFFFKEMAVHHQNVTIVFLHPSVPELMHFCSSLGIPCEWVKYSGKKDMRHAIWKLIRLLRKIRPYVVHTHLFDASMAGLTAAWITNTPVRIHTRHHASHHHVYFPHAVKYDKYINRLSTKIFAISENIKDILIKKEQVAPEKIAVVYHGFDLSYFLNVKNERVDNLRRKYHIPLDYKVIGMISRFTFWKGVQDMIVAFKLYLQQHTDVILVLANARGDYELELKKMLEEIPEQNYRLIDFEMDSPALYHLFDYFVHVPIDDHSEAFGQVYVESLAAGVPSVFTISGIAVEFVNDRIHALVVPYQNPKMILDALLELRNDVDLRKNLSSSGRKTVDELFGVEAMVNKTLYLYER